MSSSSRNSTQHSDQYASELGTSYVNNGGGQGISPDDMAVMFAPAEHTEGIKRRKERKRRERLLSRKIGRSKSHTPVENDVNISMASSNATQRASGSTGHPVLKLPDDDDDFDYTSNLSDSQRAVVPPPSSSPRAAPVVVTPSRLPPPREYSPPSSSSFPRESRQGTPPSARPPLASPARNPEAKDDYDVDDEDVWYGKWWMFCFPDLKP